MTRALTPPFFEIGPKNLLRRDETESLARLAGRAGAEFGITVVLTVPTAYVAPIADLDSGVLVFAQELDDAPLGPSMGRTLAEALVDAGADGAMLDHDSNPLPGPRLASAVRRAREVGLASIVCAGTADRAAAAARLGADVVLFEPPELIGGADDGPRDWIPAATEAIHRAGGGSGSSRAVLAMHAGGVATPAFAERIMAAGADGTGSTSGVLGAPDRADAVRAFLAAARAGWDRARAR